MPKGKTKQHRKKIIRRRHKPKDIKKKGIDLNAAVRSFNMFMHGTASPTHVFGHGYVDESNRYERNRYLE